MNRGLLSSIQDAIRDKKEFINDYINGVSNEEDRTYYLEHLEEIKERIKTSLAKQSISIDDVMYPFKRLSVIIPFMFATDEIQEFQMISFDDDITGKPETALHYYTRVLKNFLKSEILLILSGTRYHILSQIGFKIGSPIREKAHPIILGNFNSTEITEYSLEVKQRVNRSR